MNSFALFVFKQQKKEFSISSSREKEKSQAAKFIPNYDDFIWLSQTTQSIFKLADRK